MKNYLLTIIAILLMFSLLSKAQGPVLYGVTSSGGTSDTGVIFKYDIAARKDTVVFNFRDSSTGVVPEGTLFRASNGLLYGTTNGGGERQGGTIFSYDITTGACRVLNSLGGTYGSFPTTGSQLIQVGDSLLYGVTQEGGIYSFLNGGTIFSFNMYTDSIKTLHSFGNGNDGNTPLGALFLASNGLLYGTTNSGGIDSFGTIFTYNIATGVETVVHNFGMDGQYPWNGFIQVGDSLLYGLTSGGGGGANTYGTIFSFNIYTDSADILHSFGNSVDSDGINPTGELIKASNGLLYGLTQYGGGLANSGIIFSYDLATGTEAIVHRFDYAAEGYSPYGSLIQVGDSLLYGLTQLDGIDQAGILFGFNIYTDSLTVLHRFKRTDGAMPLGSLIVVYDTIATGSPLMTSKEGTMIFPNPSNGLFTIKVPGGKKSNYPLEVYNMLGEKIYQSALDNAENIINLSDKPTGMYFIFVHSEVGIITSKVSVVR